MRLYPTITELAISSVYKAGVPNSECIIINPLATVDISAYGVFVGRRSGPDSLVTPVRDLFFWFGEGILNPDDCLILFSGSGEASRKPAEGRPGYYIFCYWGRPTTLFHDNMYTPFLLRYDAIAVLAPPAALPQL